MSGQVLGMPELGRSEPYVNGHQLAEMMGVSYTTIKRWTRAGMPSETWGLRARVFRPSQAMAWARARGRMAA